MKEIFTSNYIIQYLMMGFEIYLVEYKEDYDRNDWDYSNPTMKAMEEGSSTVKLLNKKKIIQFVEIEREMTNK